MLPHYYYLLTVTCQHLSVPLPTFDLKIIKKNKKNDSKNTTIIVSVFV